jgi:hypothetical protein
VNDSLGRLVVALARQSPTVNGFMGFEPTFITIERFSAARDQPIRRTDPANCRTAAGVVQIKIGAAKWICTGANALTRRDAGIKSYLPLTWPAGPKPTGEGWSPWSDSHRRLRVYETRPVAAEAQGL